MHSVYRPVFKTEYIFPAMDQFSSQAKGRGYIQYRQHAEQARNVAA
jgi:hypothetical protein